MQKVEVRPPQGRIELGGIAERSRTEGSHGRYVRPPSFLYLSHVAVGQSKNGYLQLLIVLDEARDGRHGFEQTACAVR
jgi:hypothetical protein